MDKVIEKIKALMADKNSRIVILSAAGILLLLLVVKAAVPKNVNIFINNGDECQNAMKTARKRSKIKTVK